MEITVEIPENVCGAKRAVVLGLGGGEGPEALSQSRYLAIGPWSRSETHALL